jgi:hypothetical protein
MMVAKSKLHARYVFPFRIIIDSGGCNNYADCDVIPMEACSLLLGRPWQYDNDSLHHGRLNHYSFMFKGQKIIIHPMTPDQIIKDDLARASKTAKQHAPMPSTPNQVACFCFTCYMC